MVLGLALLTGCPWVPRDAVPPSLSLETLEETGSGDTEARGRVLAWPLEERADARIVAADAGDELGAALAVGDLDGDKALELLTSAIGATPELPQQGAVYVLSGGWAQGRHTVETGSGLSVTRLLGEQEGDHLGSTLTLWDREGDGILEWLASAPFNDTAGSDQGILYLWSGSPEGASLDSAARILGPVIEEGGYPFMSRIGSSVLAAQLTGDEPIDLLIAASDDSAYGSNSGRVFLLDGAELHGGENTLDPPLLRGELRGQSPDDHLGAGIDAADLDGDGLQEILICASKGSWEGEGMSAIYLFLGGSSFHQGTHDPSQIDPDVVILRDLESKEGGDTFNTFRAPGDIDGDGLGDVLAAAHYASEGAVEAGALYLFSAPFQAEVLRSSEATARILGTQAGANLGSSVAGAGDLDGDERMDLLAAAPSDSAGGRGSGAAWLLPGGFQGTSSLSEVAFIRFEGSLLNGLNRVFGPGDLDSDGLPDLIFRAPDTARGGLIWVVSGASLP